MMVEFYQDKQQQWRWRALDGNELLADSGEGYQLLEECERDFVRLVLGVRVYSARTAHVGGEGGGRTEGYLEALIDKHKLAASQLAISR